MVAVDDLDLEVLPGECFGLLGPNGAGKTTTIEICEGLTAPDAGEVLVLGEQWGSRRSLRERLGISLQETQFSEKLTVTETLELFRSFYRRPRPLEEVLAAVQLGEKRNGRVGQLSGGQKQRLALACALVADPELFFLDEPTTGLDPQSRRQLWDLIEEVKRAGRTVVITTHYMEEAERLCDRVAIDHGKVIALGTPRHRSLRWGSAHHRIQCPADQPTSRPSPMPTCSSSPLPEPSSAGGQPPARVGRGAPHHPGAADAAWRRGFPAGAAPYPFRDTGGRVRHLTGRTSAMAEVARRAERPLVRLTHVRILEFIREPEAIFWTFSFPC